MDTTQLHSYIKFKETHNKTTFKSTYETNILMVDESTAAHIPNVITYEAIYLKFTARLINNTYMVRVSTCTLQNNCIGASAIL